MSQKKKKNPKQLILKYSKKYCDALLCFSHWFSFTLLQGMTALVHISDLLGGECYKENHP